MDAQASVEAQELQAFEVLMRLREGCSVRAYRDTRGRLTVGIGHLVTAADDLEWGDIIIGDRVDALFAADAAVALSVAREQAAEAGISSTHFVPFLASVNFQLGTGWRAEFPQTWATIVAGDYERAAEMLDGTRWQAETPVRVSDFQAALRNLPALAPAVVTA